MSRPIGFLTDLGVRDDAVGICKGLMLKLSPGSTIVDICHDVAPFDVVHAARCLADAPSYFPSDAVFAVIVIPETGTGIDHVAVTNRAGQVLVAPDNGVLTLAAPEDDIVDIRRIDRADAYAEDRSPTFDGRDVIAYCAGRIAGGLDPRAVGPRKDALRRLPLPTPALRGPGAVDGSVTLVDIAFGNVWTNIPASLCRAAGLRTDGTELVTRVGGNRERHWPFVPTFGDVPVGGELAYLNSRGYLSFGVNRGSLVDRIPVAPGDPVEVCAERVARDGFVGAMTMAGGRR